MSVMDTVKGWFNRPKDQGMEMADKGRDTAGDATDRGQEMANKAADEVKERMPGKDDPSGGAGSSSE
jgi:hypothetical protein